MDMRIGELFTVDIQGPDPTIKRSRLVGPEPPLGRQAHLTQVQIKLYSPGTYHYLSWPWKGYNRVPRDEHRLPT
eukprot:13542054-Heterocapsa_arctica.AAC.1